MSARTKKTVGAAVVAACVILHFYTSVRTFFENWYNDYTVWSWTFLGLWLLCLLALDIWLFFLGGAELLRSLKWFWGFSDLLFAVFFLGGLLDWTLPDLAALVFVICSFLTPLYQLEAVFWLLRVPAEPVLRVFIGFLFCLIHFVYIARLHRRAKERGETAHGPVDPGAGILESEL